ncbi:P-loop containing nucleoside triphosphate hydrolase protein [Ampelomyces quisqualis]|uniref:P-loop containing nucleoside triphosphate hydrolase protein n=1 Tax=Ampelomyces quisqualis TaxID=50730 RepID=A0A6A5Q987_AMPQU|nr:P-loop containing nucleoside triphosphate hydrolase protein [Ampelomyces quisqualis]
MPAARAYCLSGTLAPFLYPAFAESTLLSISRRCLVPRRMPSHSRCSSTTETPSSRLDPTADDYSLTPFADRCILTIEAGGGGHGCVSFLREKYIEEGPANGGDGGSGGNVYIQAVRGETSLHKLARRRLIKAGRGRNGQGKVKGGERGTDILITVPIGTIVREIQRHDPMLALEEEHRRTKRYGEDEPGEEGKGSYNKTRWLVYPGTIPSELNRITFPRLPPPRRSHLAALEPEAPMWLDLDKHMETPLLIAAGAMGGLGNPHFMTPHNSRPKMATRGDQGLKISVQLELKILADLGLVGLPNAGKSTLLRALSNSRARVGNWAFTTLQPNVGTVVLDNHKGRPLVTSRRPNGELRDNFTVADVPGLIEDAHKDKGLGLGFLRHIERAAVLAFVIDLSAGDAVAALKLLWREVSEYEAMRGRELNAETERRTVVYQPANMMPPSSDASELVETPTLDPSPKPLPFLSSTPISSKPWFVVATKADLEYTRDNYQVLQQYLQNVIKGIEPHPSNRKHAWRRNPQAVPVSAIKAEGVEVIPQLVMDMLEE